MSVTLIVAVGKNGVIGRDNDLPWRLPEDLKRFKRLTLGHTLVMGRKTYDSIGRPLPGRATIVVTRRRDWSADGVTVAYSLPEALSLATGDRVFVAGGGEIYRQALPYADGLEVTEVDQTPDGDVTFPDLDPAIWQEVAREPYDGFSFVTYRRKRPGTA
jgi:dihydrofolate reductase